MTIAIPAHTFEPMKRANPDGSGLIDDPMCGYHYSINDEIGVFCTFTADHRVHDGSDVEVRVRDEEDEIR